LKYRFRPQKTTNLKKSQLRRGFSIFFLAVGCAEIFFAISRILVWDSFEFTILKHRISPCVGYSGTFWQSFKKIDRVDPSRFAFYCIFGNLHRVPYGKKISILCFALKPVQMVWVNVLCCKTIKKQVLRVITAYMPNSATVHMFLTNPLKNRQISNFEFSNCVLSTIIDYFSIFP